MQDLLSIGTNRRESMIGTGIGLGLAGYRLRTSFEAMLSLDLQFADRRMIQAVLGPTPSFSRASTGTFFNSQGVLTSAAVNGPRFNHVYNGASWVSKGLLVEEQRTNSNINSEDLTNASWSKYQVTISGNATTAPDGTTTADKIVETSANDIHVVYADFVVSSPKTYSVFLKAAERTAATISFDTASTSIYLAYVFDLANGSISKTANTSTATASASIQNVGNGWYRCSVTISSIGNLDGNRGGRISPNTSNNPTIGSYGLETYTGDISKGILAWGVQYEAGAFPTSYIGTTNSSVVRSASVSQLSGNDFSGFWNSSEGTLVVEGDSVTNGTTPFVCIDDNTSSERIEIYGSDTDPKVLVVDGGSTQVDIDAGTISNGTAFKLAFAYKLNDFAVSLNGGAVATDTVGTLPTVDRLRIGSNQAGNYLNGHIARLRYYPTRLTNAKLQELST